ncbi:MAG TPA: matrixin family metalloprotease [Kofleriaceae bacterium]
MKWLMVVVLAGCISPVMTFGGGKSAKQAQHDTLNSHLLPSQLSTEGRWRGPVKDAKIRVYADDQYRAQNLNWREAFEARLDYANAVLGPNFGVRLVADYREWNHHSPGASLAEDLEQLHQLDSGDDVLTVIGLTSSLSLVSATFEQLGYANVPGRHMMLRGYADVEERKAFARAFPDLSADERENALEARRQHKTAAVLLHELAHNLGADHEEIEDTLMNPTYSEHAAEFSTGAHATMQRHLDQRIGRSPTEMAPITAMAASAPAASAPAAPPANLHPKMQIVMLAKGVMVDGKLVDDGTLDTAFSKQAAADSETQLVISKEKGVPSASVVKLIDRAKTSGLKNITFQ